jgi:hypothetical protein
MLHAHSVSLKRAIYWTEQDEDFSIFLVVGFESFCCI